MKRNREQIYEFVKLHSSVNANHGISTNEIAEALGMQRTNVSTALGELLREGRVKKSSSRPVLYSLTEAFADEEGAFRELVGYDGSLKYAVQLARAALLYPHRGLNVLLIGREGSGRKYMAEVMHKAAVQQGLVAEQAPFVMCDCMDFGADDAATIAELLGDGVQGGMLAEAATGILFLHKVQFLSVNVRRKLLCCFVEAEDAREQGAGCDFPAGRPRAGGDKAPVPYGASASRAAEAAGTFSGGGGMQNEAHDHAGVRGAYLPDAVPL